jgi:hypothetical protein
VALFTVANIWNQPRYTSTDEQVKKMWYIYIMEYYLVKKNKILSFAALWVELEDHMLNEIS